MEEQIKRLIRQGETDTSITKMTGASYTTINNIRNTIIREEKKKWKHIKPFKESIELIHDKLKSFCRENLAYLLDEGFSVSVNDKYITIFYDNRRKNWKERPFDWLDVSDDIIPFLILFKDKFKYKRIFISYYNVDDNDVINFSDMESQVFNIDTLIGSNIDDLKNIESINIEL